MVRETVYTFLGLCYLWGMYTMAMIIFSAGIISGAAWGVLYTDSVLQVTMATVVGGFAGSAAGAACFTALYLFSSNGGDDSFAPVEEKAVSAPVRESVRQLPGPSDEKRIKKIEKELNQLKKKRKKNLL